MFPRGEVGEGSNDEDTEDASNGVNSDDEGVTSTFSDPVNGEEEEFDEDNDQDDDATEDDDEDNGVEDADEERSCGDGEEDDNKGGVQLNEC